MLESYTLSSATTDGDTKDYNLEFKVGKGIKVTFKENGDTNEVYLNYDPLTIGNNYSKKYKVTGPLKLQFYQVPVAGAGKDEKIPTLPNPDIVITP